MIDFKKYIRQTKSVTFDSLKNKLVYSHDETLFLQGLTRCRKEAISDTVNAIILPHPVPVLVKAGDKRPNILYERSNYQHLLTTYFSDKTLIVGTPYTGKTSFLFYFLLRILNGNNSAIFDPLPSTCPGSLERPKVVIYSFGLDLVLYFLDELKAYTYRSVDEKYHFTSCFLAHKILCLYDIKSDYLLQSANLINNLTLGYFPIIIAVSLHQIDLSYIYDRLKSYRSFKVITQSLWTYTDLMSITMYNKTRAGDILEYKGQNYDESKSHNSDLVIAELHQSYYVYGATMRSIQPYTTRYLGYMSYSIQEAIITIDFIKLWNINNKYYYNLESIIYHYIFHTQARRLDNTRIRLIEPASRLVCNSIYETYLTRYSHDELVQSIQTIEKFPHIWRLTRFSMLLQLYLTRQISTAGGTDGWTVRTTYSNRDLKPLDLHIPTYFVTDSDLKPFNLHMPVERGTMPAFADMLSDVLYTPDHVWKRFLVYKSVNSNTGVYDINMIRVDLSSPLQAVIDIKSVNKVYYALGLDVFTSDIKCNYYTCPLRAAQNTTVVTINNEPMPSFLGSVSIIHLPPLFEPEPAFTD